MNSYRQDPVRPAVKSSTENSDKKNKFAAIDHLSEEKDLDHLSFYVKTDGQSFNPIDLLCSGQRYTVSVTGQQWRY